MAETLLRLKIEGVIASAQEIGEKVRAELPTHSGLTAAAQRVIGAAKEAERVSRAMRRPWSLHRAPPYFLALALLALGAWIYWRFFYVSTLTIALPDRDAAELQERLSDRGRVQFKVVSAVGVRGAAELVESGKVDLAFVQGGVPMKSDLPRLEGPSPEMVFWLTREGIVGPADVRRVLTSLPDDGSHLVAGDFCKAWRIEGRVTFLHEWQELAREDYELPKDVDAVFVVKDPADEQTLAALARLTAEGFRLRSPTLGVRATKFDYLRAMTVPVGHFGIDPPLLAEPLETYTVSNYLYARRGLTPRHLGVAAHVFDNRAATFAEGKFDPTASDASELFQGVEAFLGIIVNIGLAFLALLGLEMFTYRKRFHELNSLVSLLSMLQSNKGVLGVRDPALRKENLLYLGVCSDLFGLVSMISGYYTQENSSLLFNNLSEVIHERCETLKINIQLKILHATIDLPEPPDAIRDDPQVE